MMAKKYEQHIIICGTISIYVLITQQIQQVGLLIPIGIHRYLAQDLALTNLPTVSFVGKQKKPDSI